MKMGGESKSAWCAADFHAACDGTSPARPVDWEKDETGRLFAWVACECMCHLVSA
jgi:hypothetical protein